MDRYFNSCRLVKVSSFAVGFSLISVFFPVQRTGPANTSHVCLWQPTTQPHHHITTPQTATRSNHHHPPTAHHHHTSSTSWPSMNKREWCGRTIVQYREQRTGWSPQKRKGERETMEKTKGKPERILSVRVRAKTFKLVAWVPLRA